MVTCYRGAGARSADIHVPSGLLPLHKDKFVANNHVKKVFNGTELLMAEMGTINSVNWVEKGATTAVKNQGQWSVVMYVTIKCYFKLR